MPCTTVIFEHEKLLLTLVVWDIFSRRQMKQLNSWIIYPCLISTVKHDWKQQSHKITSKLAVAENEIFPKPETKAEYSVN